MDALVESLKEELAAKRLVFVVGAGVSVGATRGADAASWQRLIAAGVEHCAAIDPSIDAGWKARVLAEVSSGRMEEMLSGASKVASVLRAHGGEWAWWLKKTVGSLRVADPELLDAMGALRAPIVTTNFDDLIARHLELRPITWQAKPDQTDFLRGEAPETIFHLHGVWHDAESVIFSSSDYQRVLSAPLPQATLRSLAHAHSLVFIGFGAGLDDPNFSQLLEWVGSVLKDARHRHFRLVRASERDSTHRVHTARNDHVAVIPYGDEYGDLPRFLRSLAGPGASKPADIRTAPAVSAASVWRPQLSPGEYVRLQSKGREAIERLATLAQQLRLQTFSHHSAELGQLIEQDLYRVAITGKSRAGKSSLVNALIGRTICPVNDVLTTAIPIVVGPAAKESVMVTFRDGKPPHGTDGPVRDAMLVPYADQEHNPDNEKGVERIEVKLGHRVLDLGVEYIDIPGFDDPTGAIWSATNDVIRRAHALILVFDVSTVASGGFTLDQATRAILEDCRKRRCPVLLVGNKADLLTSSNREKARSIVRKQLARFGLENVSPDGPVLVSAAEAVGAQDREEVAPRTFAQFEGAVWNHLWSSDSIGLRRLHRVFDKLRIADEEIAVLFEARYASQPVREKLRAAMKVCRERELDIVAAAEEETAAAGAHFASVMKTARGELARAIREHVARLTTEGSVPPVEDVYEGLHDWLVESLTLVGREIDPLISRRDARASEATEAALSDVRSALGLPQTTASTRTLAALSEGLALPDGGRSIRSAKRIATGLLAAGAVLTAFTGIGGVIAAVVAGFAAPALRDALRFGPASPEDLRRQLEARVVTTVEEFETNVADAIGSSHANLNRRVRNRVNPFLADLEDRLDLVRNPTEDEVRLRDEMRRTTAEALATLEEVFATHEGHVGGSGTA